MTQRVVQRACSIIPPSLSGVNAEERSTRAQRTSSFIIRQEQSHKGFTVCSTAIMISYTIIVSFCLLGMVSAQTGLTLDQCITKENNLVIICKTNSSPITKCTYFSEGKLVASSDTTVVQDSTYKNRARAEITGQDCKLTLTGFASDKPQTFNCTIVGTTSMSKDVNVDKKNLLTCSACSIFQRVGVTLLLALVASHLMPSLL